MDKDNHSLQNPLFSLLHEVINTNFPEVLRLEKVFLNAKNSITEAIPQLLAESKLHDSYNLISVQKFIQYAAIKLLLNNLVDNIEFVRNANDKYPSFIISSPEVNSNDVLNKLTSLVLEPVLTSHPTEPFSSEILNYISTLHNHLEEHYLLFNKELVKDILLKLMEKPLTPQHKLSVQDEIKENLDYFYKLYSSLPALIDRITDSIPVKAQKLRLKIKNHSFLKPRSWVGGDADGNPNATAQTMLDAVIIQSKAVIGWHIEELKKILSESSVSSQIYPAILKLRLLLTQYLGDIKNLEENFQSFIAIFDEICKNNKLNKRLKSLRLQLNTFKFHLASIDARQNARVYEEVYLQISQYLKKPITYIDLLKGSPLRETIFTLFKENKFLNDYPLIHKEFERIEAITKFPNIFSNLIISDTQSLKDILNPIALCKIFNANPNIVPLFETIDALSNALTILGDCINNKYYKDFQKNKQIKIMLGYSDSAKEAGIFVLPMIQKVAQDMEYYFKNQNVKYSIFHGNGLDLARGGPTIFAKEQTLQGNQKRYFLTTPGNALLYFFHTLNYELHKNSFPKASDIVKLAENSIIAFKNIFNSKEHLSMLEEYLFHASPYWLFVKPNNFSSRASTRKDNDDGLSPFEPWLNPNYYPNGKVLEGIRAISQVNTVEGTFLNFNLWYGLEEFLRSSKTLEIDTILSSSPIASGLVLKSLIGLELTDLELTKAFFPAAQPTDRFFSFMEKKYKSLSTLKESINLKLPELIKKELSLRKELAAPIKYLMSFACRNLIYKTEGLQPKFIRDVFLSELDNDQYLKLIAELFGAAYCGFTEYRTPPYALLAISFASFLKANHLSNGESKS